MMAGTALGLPRRSAAFWPRNVPIWPVLNSRVGSSGVPYAALPLSRINPEGRGPLDVILVPHVQADFAEAIGWSQMGAQITKTDFTCQLVTIRSKKSFAEVTGEIERLFQRYDIDEFRDLTTAGDAEKLAAYVKQVGEPTEFGIFFQMDQGSTMRLAGIPIESRFYLLGNATIAQGLFRYSASAGLGAPVRFCVSQRDGEETRIDIDQPTSFFSQFPELRTSSVPAELSERMVPLLERVAS